jgi:hypothetical protein
MIYMGFFVLACAVVFACVSWESDFNDDFDDGE